MGVSGPKVANSASLELGLDLLGCDIDIPGIRFVGRFEHVLKLMRGFAKHDLLLDKSVHSRCIGQGERLLSSYFPALGLAAPAASLL